MDSNGITALSGTGLAGTILTVGMLLYKTVNHKRCRSNCCGRNLIMSMDVENTTPPDLEIGFTNPIPQRIPGRDVLPSK